MEPAHDNSGPLVDVAEWKLSSGEPVSPLVWSAGLTSPLGENLARSNLRCVARLAQRCTICRVQRYTICRVSLVQCRVSLV